MSTPSSPAARLSPERERWLPTRGNFLFPTNALSSVFRGKYLDFLAQSHRGGELCLPDTDDFDHLTTALRSHDWVVYTKPPFAGAAHVLAYLARYTHKIAIANHRLVDFDGEHVRFRWRDYADGNRRKTMCLHADDFVRRFLSHVLPRGFTRLRHYGLLANRGRDGRAFLLREDEVYDVIVLDAFADRTTMPAISTRGNSSAWCGLRLPRTGGRRK